MNFERLAGGATKDLGAGVHTTFLQTAETDGDQSLDWHMLDWYSS